MSIVEDTVVAEDLGALLDSEWLHRSWTFQEILLSPCPIIIRGNTSLSWDMISGGLYTILYIDGGSDPMALFPFQLAEGEIQASRKMYSDLPAVQIWLELCRTWSSLNRPTSWNSIPYR